MSPAFIGTSVTCRVKHLVFIKNSPALGVKIIAVAVSLGRVRFVRSYLIVSHGVDNEAPLCVTVIGDQILAVLHIISCYTVIIGHLLSCYKAVGRGLIALCWLWGSLPPYGTIFS